MNFSEKLNILFKDSGQTAAIVDGESFILKSLPGTTNITVLDPNDDLYIDTDYDGTYEDNTLQYTSNEIRFKFKSRANPTYEFYSYQIDGIELIHKLNNLGSNSESILVPSVLVVDYKLDTDGDEISDYNDLTDNDGCWDVVEAGYLSEDLMEYMDLSPHQILIYLILPVEPLITEEELLMMIMIIMMNRIAI